MTGEGGMSFAVAGRKRQTVQTACRLAECSRKWSWNDGTGSHKGPDHMLSTYLLSILCIVFCSVFTCAWYLLF